VKQPRILVIEQDPVLTASIVSALEEAGFSVTTANDVVEGLRQVYENYADLAGQGTFATAPKIESWSTFRQLT